MAGDVPQAVISISEREDLPDGLETRRAGGSGHGVVWNDEGQLGVFVEAAQKKRNVVRVGKELHGYFRAVRSR
jgi:hypothetical protein